MKKKRNGLQMLLLVGLCLVLSACAASQPDPGNTFQIYCISSTETKVEAHNYEMQAEEESQQLEELLSCLAKIPERLEYKPPLAMGFDVKEVQLRDGMLHLDVSSAYLTLSATTKVLVRAAIVRTLTQLDSVRYVEMTVNGNPLYDNNKEPVGWMNAEQFIDNDGNAINNYELARIMLYFADQEGKKLIPNFRQKRYSTNIPLERFVVEELIAGPSGQVDEMYPSINAETKLLSISTKDGVCYVNLDASFLSGTGNVSSEVSIYSIVNSLVELSNINKVQILIGGQIPETFQSTYERNLDYVARPT